MNNSPHNEISTEKNMKQIITIIAALSFAAISAQADIGYNSYAAGGTAIVGTNYVIIPNLSKNGGQPVVNFLSATGTNTSAAISFYTSTKQSVVAATNSTTTVYVATNGWAADDIIVIQHNKAGLNVRSAYERRQVASLGAASLVLNVAPTTATLPGDLVWKQTSIGSIPVGVATANTAVTLTITGPCITGERNQPLLIDNGGVGATTINAVNATFVP